MLEYIFIGAIGSALILMYCLINSQGTVCRLFGKALTGDKKRKRYGFYIERFREHRQGSMNRNIVLQVLPWAGVLTLVFVLSNQYLYFATVLSGSMQPTFKKGDLVLMQTIDKKPNVGDIIMFGVNGLNEPVTHRIIALDKYGGLHTKGDNNPDEDSWVINNVSIAGKAVTVGRQPVVIKGLGATLIPEASDLTIAKLPVVATLFQQFRSLLPLILIFCTIFYFFTLIETRADQNRRFNNHKNGRNGRNGFMKEPRPSHLTFYTEVKERRD